MLRALWMCEESLIEKVQNILDYKWSSIGEHSSWYEFSTNEFITLCRFVEAIREQAKTSLVIEGESQENYETARRAITLLRDYSRASDRNWWQERIDFLKEVEAYPDWVPTPLEAYVSVLLFHPSGAKVIAIAKRKNSEYYQVPGGKQEGGETVFETASRELQEETGIYKPPHAFRLIDTREMTSILNKKKIILHTVASPYSRVDDILQVTEPDKNEDWFWAGIPVVINNYKPLPGLAAVLEQYYA